MGLVTWIAIGVIVLVAIGLGWGVLFSGLLRGAEIVSENPVVQNATRETIESADDAADTELSSTNVVIVETERTVYRVNDPVIIVVKNEGNDKVVFSDSTPDVEVRNKDTGRTYDVAATQASTELRPGESVTITWDKTAGIEAGTYVAVVKADDGTVVGETTFTIEA